MTLRTTRHPLRRTGFIAVLITAALVVAGCTSQGSAVVTVTSTAPPELPVITAPGLTDPSANDAASSALPSEAPVTTQAADGVRITTKPRFGAKNIAPNDPVQITVFSAKITALTMTGDDGTTVTGKLSDDQQTWTTAERLNYNTTYTLAGTATASSNGQAVPIKGTVATVKPAKTMGVQINIPDGGTVGIAAPIIITFLGQVSDRAAAEKSLNVTTSAGDKVQGNWAWVQDEDFQQLGFKQSQAHWRPTKSPAGSTPYWPAGTKVTVTANLKGVDFGGGNWGRDDLSTVFTIRPQELKVIADASTFHLIVQVDDKVVKNWPVSYGKNSVPGRATTTGIHVVTAKHPVFKMCNQQFEYCGVAEKWAVRINNNGEFIHQNLNAAKSFGIANVSHGCINMGDPSAKEFYDMAMYGDPVEITNTGGPALSEKDTIYDWIFTPDAWKAMSALR